MICEIDADVKYDSQESFDEVKTNFNIKKNREYLYFDFEFFVKNDKLKYKYERLFRLLKFVEQINISNFE